MNDLIRRESLDSPEMRHAIVGNRVSLLATGVYFGTVILDVIASHSSMCAEAVQCATVNNTFQIVETVSGAVALLGIMTSDRLMQNARDAYMGLKNTLGSESVKLREAKAALKAERSNHANTRLQLQEAEIELAQHDIGRIGGGRLYGPVGKSNLHS